jgi:hypothetical protein
MSNIIQTALTDTEQTMKDLNIASKPIQLQTEALVEELSITLKKSVLDFVIKNKLNMSATSTIPLYAVNEVRYGWITTIINMIVRESPDLRKQVINFIKILISEDYKIVNALIESELSQTSNIELPNAKNIIRL